jgi:hypothetical protein
MTMLSYLILPGFLDQSRLEVLWCSLQDITLSVATAEELQASGVGAVFSAQFVGLKTVDLLEYLVPVMASGIENRCVDWFEISRY